MSASPDDRVLVVGEALVDLIRRPGRPEVARVGGSPLNVAVGLSRLDVPAVLHTGLGTDEYGAMVEAHLEENAVGLVVPATAGRRTSTAVATVAADGSASYAFDLDATLEPGPAGAPRLLHTGSIGAVVEPGAAVVAATIAAVRDHATISYDPNVRPQLMGSPEAARARIEALVAQADVVKASSEDLAWLCPGEEHDDIATRWLHLGPALVVVTRGEEGASAAGATATVKIPAPPTTLVDTIGAGDSFMAGLLAALDDAGLLGRANEPRLRALDAAALTDLLEYAAACAAVTVSRPGADPPRRDALPGYQPA